MSDFVREKVPKWIVCPRCKKKARFISSEEAPYNGRFLCACGYVLVVRGGLPKWWTVARPEELGERIFVMRQFHEFARPMSYVGEVKRLQRRQNQPSRRKSRANLSSLKAGGHESRWRPPQQREDALQR